MGGTSLRVHECGGMWMTDLPDFRVLTPKSKK